MLKLGFAGIGMIAKKYIGLICQGQVPGVEVTALCSRSLENIQEAVRSCGLTNAAVFTDYSELLRSGAADAVVVCTPNGQHPPMTQAALEAGLHVLTEKPAGIWMDEIDRAVAALEQRPELVGGVMYNRRMSQAYRKVKSLIQEGFLGELVRATWLITTLYRPNAYYASGAWRGSWQGEGGGLLMTQVSHQLDLLQWLCGMPVSVLARCRTVNRPIEVENEAELLLTFANGAHGQFIASGHEQPGTDRLEICGTKGRIVVTDGREVEICRLAQEERAFTISCTQPFGEIPSTVERLSFDDGTNEIQQAAALANFAEAVAGRSPIMCSLQEGVRSLQMIQAAYLSHWNRSEMAIPADPKAFPAALEERGFGRSRSI